VKLRSWIKNEDGAAAAEFALVMIPFLGLILMALQTTIVMFMDQALQTAAQQATRQLMTGSAQTQGLTAAQFKSKVCAFANGFNCNGIMVDVQSASTFTNLNTNSISLSYNAQGQVTNNFNYQPGNAGDVIIVRVMYNWPIFGGPLAGPLVNQPGGNHLLVSTVVFKNEPYA